MNGHEFRQILSTKLESKYRGKIPVFNEFKILFNYYLKLRLENGNNITDINHWTGITGHNKTEMYSGIINTEFINKIIDKICYDIRTKWGSFHTCGIITLLYNVIIYIFYLNPKENKYRYHKFSLYEFLKKPEPRDIKNIYIINKSNYHFDALQKIS